MLGLLLCGLGLGAGASFSYLNSDSAQKVYETTYMVHGILDDHGFGFPVQTSEGLERSVTLGEGNGAYTIHVVIEPDNGEQKFANVTICQYSDMECVQVEHADMQLGGGISPSVWQTDVNDKQLFLVVQPAVTS